jgi:hypothetical protein
MRGHLKRHAVGYLALFVALGGVSYAKLVAPNGTVRGCVKTKTGALRVVKPTAKCVRGEKVISWNRRGPAGAVGPAGPDGARGADGERGATGPQGIQGETGTVDTSNFYDKAASDARHGVRVEERPASVVQSANGSVTATLIDLGEYAVTHNCAKSADPASSGARVSLRNDTGGTVEVFIVEGAETTRLSMSSGSTNGTSDRATANAEVSIRWVAPGLDLTVFARAAQTGDGPVTCSYTLVGTLA